MKPQILIGRVCAAYSGPCGGGGLYPLPPAGQERMRALLQLLAVWGYGRRGIHLISAPEDRQALAEAGVDLALLESGPEPRSA
jgi:hypothetical protein